MGDIDIDIDIDGSGKVGHALRKGLSEGLEDTGNTLMERGEEKGEDVVTGARKVWTEEVKRSFDSEENQFNRYYHWKGKITNSAKHAKIVDVGLAPAGEITGASPSVQDLMPWVVSNLSPSDYGGGDGHPGFTPGGGGNQPPGLADPDATVTYKDLDELGLRAGSFQSDAVKAAEIEDGTNAVWKSHIDPDYDPKAPEWQEGVIRNEAVWSKAAEAQDWDLGPKSRIKEADTIQGERSGTLQGYVEGQQSKKLIFTGFGDPDDYEYTTEEWLEENREWAAKTTTIDFLVGNGDRHFNNIRLTEDREPRGIDNGGNQFDEDLSANTLNLNTDILNYDTAVNPDKLYQETKAQLDEIEKYIEEIVLNDERRRELLDIAEEVHGPNSREYERMERALGDEIGPGHILSEAEDGTPLYKVLLDAQRERYDRIYNDGELDGAMWKEKDDPNLDVDDDGEVDRPSANLNDDALDEELNGIEHELNSMFGDDDNEE